ncbi:MAG: lytic transglycosylase domain-containing protein [Rhizobiales bacterium]|nr:lytic transglycosylase domain-containing protein [Hyphomicrobiales bacterium]
MVSLPRHLSSPASRLKRLLPLALGLLALALAFPAHGSVRTLCDTHAAAHERANQIPPGLLQAVALAESGRWLADDQSTRPWPWTVTSGADSFYLPSKDAAIAKVRELKARGRTNIDVGCMQINLHYHPRAFASLEEAFDPDANVAYGSKFLKELRLQTRSWGKATAHYHSQNQTRGNAYRSKVYGFWRKLQRGRVLQGAEQMLAGDVTADDQPLFFHERVKRPLISRRVSPLYRPDAIPVFRGGALLRGG